MSRTSLAATALSMTMLAVAGGCGGSSKAPATTTSAQSAPVTSQTAPAAPVQVQAGSPLTERQWIARGDAICTRLNAQLDSSPVKTVNDLARVLPQVAIYERAALAQLARLVPPAEKAGEWQQFLDATREWANDSSELAAAVQAQGFSTRTPLAQAARQAHENVARIAARNGFKQCSIV